MNVHPCFSETKFTLAEIAKAVGIQPVVVGGDSYGAYELVIPLSNGFGLLFREGDDEVNDHRVEIRKMDTEVNTEHKSNRIKYPELK